MVDRGMFILNKGRALITSCIPKTYLSLNCLELEMPFPLAKKKKKIYTNHN